MTIPTFQEMRHYVRFDDDDARSLRAFLPIASPYFAQIAREVSERTRDLAPEHAARADNEQLEQLQRSLVLWMGHILGSSGGHVDETLPVDIRLGPPQLYPLIAMPLIRVALGALADDQLRTNAVATRAALARRLDLELVSLVGRYDEQSGVGGATERAVPRRDQPSGAVPLYEAALDATKTLVVGFDAGGRVRLFSHYAQVVTDLDCHEVLGRPFVETLVPDLFRPTDIEAIEGLLRGERRQVAEDAVIRTRGGRLRDVRWQLMRISDEPADDIVAVAIGIDVTHEHVTSQRLRHQEALAALGTLAAGLAHEIRNPLNGALLHVSYLERALNKQHAAPEMVEAVTIVDDELRRLARLVTEFLTYARPMVLVRDRVTVQALITRAVEMTSRLADLAGVDITVVAPPDDVTMIADGAKLEQVLLNLLQNAVESLAQSSARSLIVRALSRAPDIVIEVEDDGPGLPGPDAPVFDAFFSTKPAGIGLGLAISQRIVTDHGGVLEVESRPGRTCFRVTIPIEGHLARDPDLVLT